MRFVPIDAGVDFDNGTQIRVIRNKRSRAIETVTIQARGNAPVIIRGKIVEAIMQRPDVRAVWRVKGQLLGMPVTVDTGSAAEAEATIAGLRAQLKNPELAQLQWAVVEEELRDE